MLNSTLRADLFLDPITSWTALISIMLAVLRMVSEQNMKYKPFKLYFDQTGSLILDVCLLTPGKEESDFPELGEEVYGMFDVLIKFLEENYRSWMKEIW